MDTMRRQALTLAAFALVAVLSRAVAGPILHETATLIPELSAGGYDLRSDQMAGARFRVRQPTRVTAIGGQLFASQTLLGAIVTLGPDNLPVPNPGAPAELTGILASTTFSTGGSDHSDFRTPLSVTLAPGTYGLIFGGVQNTLSGRLAMKGEPLPGAEIFTNSGAEWRDLNRAPYHRMRMVVEGFVVPEPATHLLVAMLLGWLAGRHPLFLRISASANPV